MITRKTHLSWLFALNWNRSGWRLVFLVVAIWVPVWESAAEDPIDFTEADKLIQPALTEFFQTNSYPRIELILRAWKTNLDQPMQQVLFRELNRRLDWDDRKAARPAGDLDDFPDAARQAIRHDLSSTRGRAAWALERILEVELPETKSDAAGVSWWKVRYLVAFFNHDRVMGHKFPPQVDQLSAEEKRRLASDPNTTGRVLMWLGLDPDPEVRVRVVSNPNTPLWAVAHLWSHDENAEVRQTAARNLSDGGRDTWDK